MKSAKSVTTSEPFDEAGVHVKRRKEVELTERFNKRWPGYAAAVGAAGVGLVATVPAAKADIVYDPGQTAAVSCRCLFGLNLEIGSPGADVVFAGFSFSRHWITYHPVHQTFAYATSWARQETAFTGPPSASRGIGMIAHLQPRGASIGPGRQRSFGGGTQIFYSRGFRQGGGYPGSYRKSGGWYPPNPTGGYLGLEFEGTDGQVHYGWALMDGLDLEGAAYNTVPDQPIFAGQTSSRPEPGTLGLLALGSLGLGFWRRKAVTSAK